MFGRQRFADEGNGMQDQRVAVVTGAGSGIGAASAVRLAAESGGRGVRVNGICPGGVDTAILAGAAMVLDAGMTA